MGMEQQAAHEGICLSLEVSMGWQMRVQASMLQTVMQLMVSGSLSEVCSWAGHLVHGLTMKPCSRSHHKATTGTEASAAGSSPRQRPGC